MNSWVKTKKLTAANSYMTGDTIFYIAKKMNEKEAASSQFWAYVYPSGDCVRGHDDKKLLIKWLDDNIIKIESKIKEKGLT